VMGRPRGRAGSSARPSTGCRCRTGRPCGSDRP
jgi:hypothetical protein